MLKRLDNVPLDIFIYNIQKFKLLPLRRNFRISSLWAFSSENFSAAKFSCSRFAKTRAAFKFLISSLNVAEWSIGSGLGDASSDEAKANWAFVSSSSIVS